MVQYFTSYFYVIHKHNVLLLQITIQKENYQKKSRQKDVTEYVNPCLLSGIISLLTHIGRPDVRGCNAVKEDSCYCYLQSKLYIL